jgi:hypothetical protein
MLSIIKSLRDEAKITYQERRGSRPRPGSDLTNVSVGINSKGHTHTIIHPLSLALRLIPDLNTNIRIALFKRSQLPIALQHMPKLLPCFQDYPHSYIGKRSQHEPTRSPQGSVAHMTFSALLIQSLTAPIGGTYFPAALCIPPVIATGFHVADTLILPDLQLFNVNQSRPAALHSNRSFNRIDMYPMLGFRRKSRSLTTLIVTTSVSLDEQRYS